MQAIKDYCVIGDLHSSALISKNASIDWLCLPHFDSPSIFAGLIDKNGGSLSIEKSGYFISSSYIANTAILESTFKNAVSEFKVRDYMIPESKSTCKNHFLVRKFIGVKGESRIYLLFKPRPNYSKGKIKIIFNKTGRYLRINVRKDKLLLHLPLNYDLKKENKAYEIAFTIKETEHAEVVLEYILAGCGSAYNNQDKEQQTVEFWQDWVSQGKFFNFFKDGLVRSAITLKLMQFYPTGAIVAAPTASLPEVIGGERNWDYRYVWIRDATFTLYALYVLGYLEEAEKFFEFIEKIIEKSARKGFDISLMYTIYGTPVSKERRLRLSGYKNSKPVRIGNNAAKQFQLDVYGALIDAYYFATKSKMEARKLRKSIIKNLIRKISENWLKPDHGIWEARKGRKHYTYSKVMAWVGINRALKMSQDLELEKTEIMNLQNLEKEIKNWIWTNSFDPVNKTFRQYPQAIHQDATNFLFVLLQFLNRHDPLTKTIIEQTAKELSYENIFIYRYLTKDGFRGKEGAFLLCSFWMIAVLAALEETNRAAKFFNRIQKYAAKSGLLSEEIDPNNRKYLGNFPQAFSHVGFIMGAYYIHRYTGREVSRSKS